MMTRNYSDPSLQGPAKYHGFLGSAGTKTSTCTLTSSECSAARFLLWVRILSSVVSAIQWFEESGCRGGMSGPAWSLSADGSTKLENATCHDFLLLYCFLSVIRCTCIHLPKPFTDCIPKWSRSHLSQSFPLVSLPLRVRFIIINHWHASLTTICL